MLECSFDLNGRPMSIVRCSGHSFPAFSGYGQQVNDRNFVCHINSGAIPSGSYYIVNRESGGLLGSIRDHLLQRTDWFALYAADASIDDKLFCNEVERGNFRLHPKRGTGNSKGCIVINRERDFQILRQMLLNHGTTPVSGNIRAFGRLVVR